MLVTLEERTEEHVRIYFEKAGKAIIKKYLPQKAQTVEEALEDYMKTRLPDAESYGRTIYTDNRYVGDIWCYCIDYKDTPNAMLSYCVFEPELWNNGIATEAVSLFLTEIRQKYPLKSIGAFTFAENIASIRVLEKNGFFVMEEFTEDGILSVYLERKLA